MQSISTPDSNTSRINGVSNTHCEQWGHCQIDCGADVPVLWYQSGPAVGLDGTPTPDGTGLVSSHCSWHVADPQMADRHASPKDNKGLRDKSPSSGASVQWRQIGVQPRQLMLRQLQRGYCGCAMVAERSTTRQRFRQNMQT